MQGSLRSQPCPWHASVAQWSLERRLAENRNARVHEDQRDRPRCFHLGELIQRFRHDQVETP